jgi:ubiquinone/menaquinone biosynthesis C-methylase UbiE
VADRDAIRVTHEHYERDYKQLGLRAQRLYPNEELLRFVGRRFFGSTERAARRSIKVLEVGCGTGANLWMLAREGFATYGLELSHEALRLCETMLAHWDTTAQLTKGSMTDLPFADASMNVVIDVFSSYCLPTTEYSSFLRETRRVLVPGGLLFSYTPSAASEAFVRHAPGRLIDDFTLDGIHRSDSPFTGNHYPFRFETVPHLQSQMEAAGLRLESAELTSRTYGNRRETFEFISLEAIVV